MNIDRATSALANMKRNATAKRADGSAAATGSAATTVWIPISDNPTETAHYLVWVRDGGAGWADQACIEFYNATKQQWNGESGIIEDGGEVTHWAKILPPNDPSSATA